MAIDFDRILESGARVMDNAKKTATDIAKQGKRQADLIAAQNKMAKMERQLGALVYELARKGEENSELVQKYIANMTAIDAEIEDLKDGQPEQKIAAEYAPMQPVQTEAVVQPKLCPQCGNEVQEGAVFCSSCGAQL